MAAREHNPVRIMEIVMQVISQLREAHTVDDIDIDSLRVVGYTDAEISSAVNWLVESMEHTLLFQPAAERLPNKAANFRSLHPAERHLFTKEAHGELIQLQSLGMITPQHIEYIIERSVLSPGSVVDKENLQNFVAELLFREQPRSNGSRLILPHDRNVH